jgi:hypothetical protein
MRPSTRRVDLTGTTHAARGRYFDPETWDGSDIFSPEGTAHLIVTESAKLALEEARATNWLLVALPD